MDSCVILWDFLLLSITNFGKFLSVGGQKWRCTVCSNGLYADISNQHQVQQHKSCLQSFLYFFVILKYHRCLWANIFDTDIYRCISTYHKVLYWAFLGIFMLLQMSVSKILADRFLWYFKTTKNLQKCIQTWFILLHMVLVWNVRVKFTKRAIVY